MIRPARIAEAADLARLHAEAFDDPWDDTSIAGFMAANGARAFRDDHGFILFRALAGEAEVLTLAVAPAARRQGLGRQLVEAAAEAARAAGAEGLFLEVAEDNQAARALYAATRFEPIGRRPGYYARAEGPAVTALVLRKTLTPADA